MFIDFQVAVQMKGTTRHVPAQRGRFIPRGSQWLVCSPCISADALLRNAGTLAITMRSARAAIFSGIHNKWRDIHDIFESRRHPEIWQSYPRVAFALLCLPRPGLKLK